LLAQHFHQIFHYFLSNHLDKLMMFIFHFDQTKKNPNPTSVVSLLFLFDLLVHIIDINYSMDAHKLSDAVTARQTSTFQAKRQRLSKLLKPKSGQHFTTFTAKQILFCV
jgi:hypothetical protein